MDPDQTIEKTEPLLDNNDEQNDQEPDKQVAGTTQVEVKQERRASLDAELEKKVKMIQEKMEKNSAQ